METSAPIVGRVAIIGLGLMGASLGMALREQGVAREVAGYDAAPGVAARARERSAITTACDSLAEAVAGSDLVVLATPLLAMRDLLAQMAPLLAPETVVTDLGSVKASVVTWADSQLPMPNQFVAGHPMAGSEQSGVEAGQPDLYQGCAWLLTPTRRTSPAALATVERIIAALGAHPLRLSPERHDRAVALASHLPLLVASALMLTVAQSPDAADALAIAAGGFHDTTRVASGSPRMARDICLTNTPPLLAALDAYLDALQALRTQLAAQDPAIEDAFSAARDARHGWLSSE